MLEGRSSGLVLLVEDGSARRETMASRVELRPISDHEGNRLLRIARRASGSASPGVVVRIDEFGPLNPQPHPRHLA
jgi:hypothetical protein